MFYFCKIYGIVVMFVDVYISNDVFIVLLRCFWGWGLDEWIGVVYVGRGESEGWDRGLEFFEEILGFGECCRWLRWCCAIVGWEE